MTPRRISLLAHLCMLPFVETGELAVLTRTPSASTHRNLQRLMLAGLARRVPHAMGNARRTYRWIPTSRGVRALSDRHMVSEQHLREARREAGPWVPVEELALSNGPLNIGRATAQWHRAMGGRLDILACVYRLLCSILHVEDRPPSEFQLYRSLPFDAAVRLRGGACYGIIVRRPAFGGLQFGKRLAIARPSALRLTATFIVVPGQEDMRAAAVEANRSNRMRNIATVLIPMSSAEDPDMRSCVEPDRPNGVFSLRRVLNAWKGPGSLPDETPVVRRTPPCNDMKMPPYLSTGMKRVVHIIADWPLAAPTTLARIPGLSEHWLAKHLSALRRQDLVRYLTENGRRRLALTDEGIKLVSAASRTNAREHIRHWSSECDSDGQFVGGAIRQLVREIDHNDMAHGFVAAIYRNVPKVPPTDILSVTPAHLGMKFFRHLGPGTYSIRPDTTVVLTVGGRRHVLLVEFERQAVYPKSMRKRLMPYQRYFSGSNWMRDYGNEPKVMVILENESIESRFLHSQEVAGLSDLPVFSTSSEIVGRLGPYGNTWRRLADPDADRVRFWID